MPRSALAFSCACGTVKGALRPGARGTRLVCYCQSCRRAHAYLRDEDIDKADLYLTVPEALRVDHGAEHLAAFRLTARGPIRWYVSCCRTPFANTLGSAKLPFVSLQTLLFDDCSPLGRVTVESNRPGDKGTRNGFGLAFGVFSRMIASRLSGGWRDSVFFNHAGVPVSRPERVKA